MTLEEYIKLYHVPEEHFVREEAEYSENITSKMASVSVCGLGIVFGGILPRFKTESSFREFFYDKMNEKSIESSVDVYKKCGMTKQTFSRIMNPKNHPSKHSVLALCIGLELDKEESAELLARAGFAFNPSDLRDVIVLYFIENKHYELDDINNALNKYGEDIFGANE